MQDFYLLYSIIFTVVLVNPNDPNTSSTTDYTLTFFPLGAAATVDQRDG